MKNCWICNNEATTGEHKVKKSTLKKLFSNDFKKQEMSYYKDRKLVKIQGVDSAKVKYEKVLCSTCNNEFTQPFDLAYDIFLNYIVENFIVISQKRMINFYDIYKDDFPQKQTNLFKYFVKIFGCDLSNNGFSVPQDLVDLLYKQHFQTKLQISFAINEDHLNIQEPTKGKYGVGPLVTSITNLQTKNELETWYRFEIIQSYLSIYFFYNCFVDVGLGCEWIANRQFIYIGSSDNNVY